MKLHSRPEFDWSKQKAEVQGIKWFNIISYGLLLWRQSHLNSYRRFILFLFHELWDKNKPLH